MNANSARSRWTLLVLWIAALALLGAYVQHSLVIGTDLRLFLPSPQTAQEHLLLEEIGEGPGSRVLVLAVGGGTPERLADASHELAESLAEDPAFRFVANGESSLENIPDELLPYRYLLSPTLDAHRFDTKYLHAELQARARDLASPAGAFLEPWLPRDPTLELLKLVQRWQPAQAPNRLFDVWFDAAGEQALLLAETSAAAFDPEQQRAAIEVLREAFASIAPQGNLSLTISGAGKFSVLMEERTRSEAQTLGAAATLGMILLLTIAYRNLSSVAFSALPLASAGLAGMAAVSALFGTVHGITLAFGFTLIGVAQDYPVHLLSHRRPDRSSLAVVRELWPTLATGVASTCIAYLTFLFSGVVGLQQLACFTVAGLATASLTTRFLLPRLMNAAQRDYGRFGWLDRVWTAVEALPALRWTPVLIVIGGVVALTLNRTPLWENDLSKLTPIPAELLEQDQALRRELGTSDVGHLLIVSAPDTQHALRRLEALEAQLQHLVATNAIAGFDHAARYVPSAHTQRLRQQELPDPAALRETLSEARAGIGFRAGVFEPFIADVQQAKSLPPLTPEELSESPLGASLDMLLLSGEPTQALITFNGVRDLDALQDLADSADDLMLLDLKAASETLVARQRTHILWSLLAAAVLLIVVVAVALRRSTRIYRVLAPMALTTLIVIVVLQLSGISLNLFHLIALMLAAGLGLDYALFFEHASEDRLEQRRTLHAVVVCSLSTLMVFALLASSEIPVLRAIGLTVSLGVIANFLLALTMARGGGAGLWALGSGQKQTEVTTAAQDSIEDSERTRLLSGQSPAPRAQQPLSGLIPHSDSMCLLERILDWDDERIRLTTSSHRAPANPLRSGNKLRSVHLCEYGAQAMAVHGALKSQAAGKGAAPGMLVSLRSVQFSRDYIEDLKDDLLVEAQCLQASASSLQYNFRITHRDTLLAEGRAAVVLR